MKEARDDCQRIRDVYAFLNNQMKAFEVAGELEQAIDGLLKELGVYFEAEAVALYKYENNVYTLTNAWPNFDCEANAKRKDEIVLLEGDRTIALLTLIGANEKKQDLFAEISDMLGSWLSNRLEKRDYMNRDDRVQKLLSGLGNDYTAVYMINLDTDAFEIIINQRSNNVAKEQKFHDFSSYLDNYADKYVLEDSREAMKRILRFTHLKEKFEQKKDLYFRFHTKPNSIGQTYFEAHAVRQYDGNGRFAVMGFRCVDAIVKREQKYQRELDAAYKNAQQQLDVFASSIQGGIKISYNDPAYTFKYVSKQYASMLGYSSVDELMEASGGTIVGIAHPDDLESGIAAALKQYEKSDNYSITYRMRCKDGSWKYIEDHGHKVINSEGEIEHWNLILDKNELMQKTIELESTKKAEQVKMQFLARMSHDIRTPLNGIIGLMEYEDRHPDDLKMITVNRKKAHAAANHLLSLINDILEMNKLEDNNTKLAEEPLNLIDLVHDVKMIADMRAAEDGISVFMEDSYLNISNPYVFGSSLHIKQILINIITNAIKYNKPGGSVWCRIYEDEIDSATVSFTARITDSGIGMSEDFIKNIYDPFVQEKYDARSVYTGTGLGMSIVKNLVDRMNGTISISSKVNVGTSIEITIPFKKARRSDLPPQIDLPENCDLTGVHALLVEDNELNMEIARCMLEDENIVVTEAHNGQEAVDVFRYSPSGTFDIILMDIMMPIMDGLTATKQIRALDREDAKLIPIFAMTANAFSEDVEKAKEAGMNEHIAKPIEMKKVMAKIAQYCKR